MNQKGNILFLILIAVALFAAISFAVTRSSSGGKDAKAEKEQLAGAVNDNCSANVESAVMRLTMTKGCTGDTLSYELPDGSNANPKAPADKSCHVFNPSTGGAYPCGSYLEVPVKTGPIPDGDTTSIALTTSGVYFKCQWFSGRCVLDVSPDGKDFKGTNQLCIKKGDGSDAARDNFGNTPFSNLACRAYCPSGTGTINNWSSWAGTPSYYLKDDMSIEPYTGTCDQILSYVGCDC